MSLLDVAAGTGDIAFRALGAMRDKGNGGGMGHAPQGTHGGGGAGGGAGAAGGVWAQVGGPKLGPSGWAPLGLRSKNKVFKLSGR